mmetsp:Transcript_4547/g.10182  ORF Transcript_4547/g.10182 Transcript_4547/m.10182 type:complete len:552 (-) Transcript_4547:48-1703(-)
MNEKGILDRDRLNDALFSAASRRDASARGIEGLWPDLSSAATVLRIAWSLGELDRADCDDEEALDRFFNLLLEVEEGVRKESTSRSLVGATHNCFVVAVEGLDGSGKTSLVRKISEGLKSFGHQSCSEHIHVYATPSKSLSAVRPAFDRRGGPVARAFYMCSNYILQHEIGSVAKKTLECSTLVGVPVFIIDRFYSSTCAYTVGWKNTSGSAATSIDTLPDSVFEWPADLQPPDIMLILDVDHDTRRRRVESRALAFGGEAGSESDHPPAASRHNPWDERLSNDTELGQRIIAAHRRTVGPLKVEVVDANGSLNDVADEALKIIRKEMQSSSSGRPRLITLAVTGTHCSGKRAIGRLLAGFLGWVFEPELGDILRNRDALVADGHKSGDGSGIEDDTWDDRIHREECQRDVADSRSGSRVVETWHIGNLAWTLQRESNSPLESSAILRAHNAIRDEMRRRTVVMVHLQSSSDASVRRRRQHPENALRLPMSDEESECIRLHKVLDLRAVDLLRAVEKNMNVPLLVLGNDEDGEEAMGARLARIVEFVDRIS